MSNKVPQIRFNGYSDAWVQRNLGDITAWTKGQGLPKEDLNEEKSGLEAVHYADLYKFSPVMHEVIHWTNSDDGRVIPNNSLLFPASDVTPVGLARTSTLKLSGVKAGGDVIIGQLDESIDSSFMSYQINAISKKILPLITGTTVKHVQAKSLATLSVSVTNMAEQTAIAGLFERIDKLIAANQRKLDLLKEQKKGYLQKMFPKNGAKVPELRFAGFADDWEERKLGELFKPSRNKNNNDLYNQKDILAASLGTELIPKRTFFGLKSTKESVKNYRVVKHGDLIYTKSPIKGFPNGIVRTNKGNVGIVPSLYCVYQAQKEINTSIIQLYFEDKNRLDFYLFPLVNVGARNNVNITDLEFLEGIIKVPKSIEEQNKIVDFIEHFNKAIALHQRKLDLLKEQKKGFLQKMFV